MKKIQQAPMLVPSILALITTVPLICLANSQNSKFDPDLDEPQTVLCSLPMSQSNPYKPPPDMCTDKSEGLDLSTAEELVYQYAPVIFFHPLEKYTMQSVDATFKDPEKGKIYVQYKAESNVLLPKFFANLNTYSLLNTSRDTYFSLFSNHVFFEHDMVQMEADRPTDYMYGAGFDPPEGKARKSKAPIYFNVIETDENTWTFNFYFYYTFNGHANMASVSEFGGNKHYTSFQMFPTGMHEGDWEGVSVRVCRSRNSSQPLAVNYEQHGHTFTTDCTAGECNFYKDTIHPVVFSALFSHASYPLSAYNMVYEDYTHSFSHFIGNLHFFSAVDRTAYMLNDKSYYIFLPDDKKNNTIKIHKPKDIELGNKEDESFYWQGYGGHWGNSRKEELEFEKLRLTNCLNDNQTEFIDCPTDEEDPIFGFIMQLLNIYPRNDTMIKFSSLASTIGEVALIIPPAKELKMAGTGPTGPVMKEKFVMWMEHINASVWGGFGPNATSNDYCEKHFGDEAIHTPKYVKDDRLDIKSTVIVLIVIIVFLTTINIMFLSFKSKKERMVLEFDENTGEVIELTWQLFFEVHRGSFIYSFWFLVVIIGGAMYLITCNDTLDLLRKYAKPLGSIPWDTIETLMLLVGIIVIIIDAFCCFAIWMPNRSLWWKMKSLYHEYKNEEEEAEYYKRDPFKLSFKKVHIFFIVCSSLLFVAFLLAIAAVMIGLGTAGFAYAIDEACSSLVGNLDGVCFELDFFHHLGLELDGVQCGADFQEMCNEFADSRRLVTFWGGLLIVIGQFYLVLTTGSSYHQQTTTLPMLDMLPMREEYQKRVASKAGESVKMQEDGRSVEDLAEVKV